MGRKILIKLLKKNIDRFPSDFYFQLTDTEKMHLWFQSGTANRMTRTNPYVFTEQCIAMLASVLRTEIACKTSIKIMRTFVKMRHYIKNSE